MPELPEVEIGRRQLERWTAGRRLVGVELVDPAVVRSTLSSRPSDADPDMARALAALRGPFGPGHRHGKRAVIEVAGHALLLHLGMSGKWVRRGADDELPRFARLGLRLDNGDVLWFTDQRRFGCVVLAEEFSDLLRGDTGPDALSEMPDAETLGTILTGRRGVKVALMDQARLAGLGNIHAAEALFRAKVHPAVRCSELTDDDLQRLVQAIPAQLSSVLTAEGDTDEMIYVTEGAENPFAVYGREGEPCPVCGAPVAMKKMSGRSTFWCPACQPER